MSYESREDEGRRFSLLAKGGDSSNLQKILDGDQRRGRGEPVLTSRPDLLGKIAASLDLPVIPVSMDSSQEPPTMAGRSVGIAEVVSGPYPARLDGAIEVMKLCKLGE